MKSRGEKKTERLAPRRVLIASDGPEEARLCGLFREHLAGQWQSATADTFVQAHFLMQHNPCDVILVDEGLYRREGPEGLSWLTEQTRAPLAFLASESPAALTDAIRRGAHFWLPRTLALGNPELLSAALERVAELGRLRDSAEKTGEELDEARHQADRLVRMLWQAAPMDPSTHWFTQHYMMERLFEELARSGRHGTPLTVAVGEFGQRDALPEWTARQITRHKRRSDVAGQYGQTGLLLLLVQTRKEGGVSCCRRLRQAVEGAPESSGRPVHACFGLASFSAERCTPQSLLRAAEEHLEAARAGQGEGVFGG
jgi:GGDEF domain-containing protein